MKLLWIYLLSCSTFCYLHKWKPHKRHHRHAHIMVKKLEYLSTKMVQFLLLKILKRCITDSALLWSVLKINGMFLLKSAELSYYSPSFKVYAYAITVLNILQKISSCTYKREFWVSKRQAISAQRE